MPGGLNCQEPDTALQCNYLRANQAGALQVVASNAFGFGGSNSCLVFSRMQRGRP
jgi:3-oxoacyl-[acyl-carrier-protein] synthase-1